MNRVIKYIICLTLLVCSITSIGQINRMRVYYVGQQLIIDKKYSEAIDVLNILLRTNSSLYDGYFLRGVAKYNLGDIVGAENDFTTAITINPVYTLAYQYRAITKSMLGNYGDAIDDFKTAIDIRPDKDDIYYSRGVTYFLSQQFHEAIADFNYFLRRKPRSVDGYVNRGTSYLMIQDTLSAMRDYNTAIETNIYNGAGYFRRGALYRELDSLDLSLKDLSKSIELDSTSLPAFFNRALVYAKKYEYNNAVNDFSHIIKKDSTNSLTYFNRALLRSQIGDYNNAMRDYDMVIRYSPQNVLGYFNRGILNNQLGNLDQAEDDFTKAIELYPQFANAYMNRSEVRHRKMDMKGAKSDYDIANKTIAEYKLKMDAQSFATYADTSKLFSSLLSFDADFGNKDFEAVTTTNQQLEILPMFRYTAAKQDVVFNKVTSYENSDLKEHNKLLKDYGVVLVTGDKQFSYAQLEDINKEAKNKLRDNWESIFSYGALQHSVKQYSSAIAEYSKALKLQSKDPFIYMNKAVADAEMTLFISNIDKSSHRLIIDGDPVNQLNNTERVYSYDNAMRDINCAIGLNPDIAHFYYNKAAILVLENNLVAAIENYTKAIELYPYFAEAYFNRGIIQLRIKESKKGLLDISAAGEMGISNAYEILKKYDKYLKE